jgi:hypothetical protein
MLLRFVGKLMGAIGLLIAVWWVGAMPDDDLRSSWIRPVGEPRGPVRIVRFYTNTGSIEPGDKAELCYGVENAKSVRIAPAITTVLPAGNRCLEIAPDRTTHYTILAEGFDGSIVTQPLTLVVVTAPKRRRERPGVAGLAAHHPSQGTARAGV